MTRGLRDPALGERSEAARLEAADPVRSRRDEFVVPRWPGGREPEWAYFAGNSLGLMPRGAEAAIGADPPWVDYAGTLRNPLARLVGASPDEVAVMNSLTVNLHLLLAGFYRPEAARTRILIEDAAFPSDSHAVAGQVAWHGLDPAEAVVRLRPRPGEETIRTEDVLAAIEHEGDRLAMVLLGAVNYLTGELLDVAEITGATRSVGAVSGWDLAHAVGNVAVPLHEAGADFAVWCHYKYVNAGPGGPGGLFVHDRHAADRRLPRLGGWWGVDPAERFLMAPDFVPRATAEGWAVSTPSILSLAPLRASLEQFDRVGIDALRGRSRRLTGYLEALLDRVDGESPLSMVTPRDPERRGCQLSVRVPDARAVAALLRREHGVICDFREPDVLRFAPVPLYSTYDDCYRLAVALAATVNPAHR